MRVGNSTYTYSPMTSICTRQTQYTRTGRSNSQSFHLLFKTQAVHSASYTVCTSTSCKTYMLRGVEPFHYVGLSSSPQRKRSSRRSTGIPPHRQSNSRAWRCRLRSSPFLGFVSVVAAGNTAAVVVAAGCIASGPVVVHSRNPAVVGYRLVSIRLFQILWSGR